MKNIPLNILILLVGTLLTILPAAKSRADYHRLEVAIQNCYYVKKFAKTVMEKRKNYRPFSYYENIDFTSPAAMEIVVEAYNTDQKEYKFSDKWFKKCQEISCSGFWADLDVAIKLVSD
jgi:hypothetical protein